jgi:Domain of unknown function (DUF4148)
MKTLIRSTLIALALAAPALAFAQSTNAPVTRAEVRADLARVEQAGYRPSSNDPYYPADIQAAEAKVATESGSSAATSAGGLPNVSSQSGTTTLASGGVAHTIYAGH